MVDGWVTISRWRACCRYVEGREGRKKIVARRRRKRRRWLMYGVRSGYTDVENTVLWIQE